MPNASSAADDVDMKGSTSSVGLSSGNSMPSCFAASGTPIPGLGCSSSWSSSLTFARRLCSYLLLFSIMSSTLRFHRHRVLRRPSHLFHS